MKVVINDANILIDLVKLRLLKDFSKLPFELYTTDVVYEEIVSSQKKSITLLNQQGLINIIEIGESSKDYAGIYNLLVKSNGLSFEDCSVWFYSKQMQGTLLTGDGLLRKCASKDDVEVRGIIYVFDELVKFSIIDYETAIKKIKELYSFNTRLPKKEIDYRLKLWSKLV
jgi:hypothetical protein